MTLKIFSLNKLILAISLIAIVEFSAQYNITDKMKWWYEGRFGMFIHFGSYSQLGHGEWAFSTEGWTKEKYQNNVSAKFNPTNFDAGVIARIAKQAGMKYLVITAKHHEGFSMWKTNVQSFKDVSGKKMYDLPRYTKFGSRDILKELKDSCDAQGIKFCLYYSILDWCHSSQEINRSEYYSTMQSDSARLSYIADMKAQLKELIERYNPAILWFDGDWTNNPGPPTSNKWWTKGDGVDLYNYVISLDPNILINERVARGFGIGDYECPEQEVPNSPREREWETCQTMNRSWGYNKQDENYKSSSEIIQELVRVVSRDGNYLLNIGPKGDGTIPIQSLNILNDIGNWMNIYSESIYSTTRSPFKLEPSWGYYTKKLNKLFVHVFNWPSEKEIKIPPLSNTINNIYLMESPSNKLNYSRDDNGIIIKISSSPPNPHNSVIVIEIEGIPTSIQHD
ncbi:MAG: alpha-L-fucosidase [Melioribacteraceae bacterium]|nr:alpha-L-fucosidase [Melioribacteraceae bacterium]